MKISELPPGLKELALLRQKEDTEEFYDKDTNKLLDAFGWNNTPERFNFWDDIDNGNFTPFYNCKVVNCKLKTK